MQKSGDFGILEDLAIALLDHVLPLILIVRVVLNPLFRLFVVAVSVITNGSAFVGVF